MLGYIQDAVKKGGAKKPVREYALDALGIPATASSGEVKKQYHKLSRQYHPDRNPGSEAAKNKMQLVASAYEVLTKSDAAADLERDIAISHARASSRTPTPTPTSRPVRPAPKPSVRPVPPVAKPAAKTSVQQPAKEPVKVAVKKPAPSSSAERAAEPVIPNSSANFSNILAGVRELALTVRDELASALTIAVSSASSDIALDKADSLENLYRVFAKANEEAKAKLVGIDGEQGNTFYFHPNPKAFAAASMGSETASLDDLKKILSEDGSASSSAVKMVYNQAADSLTVACNGHFRAAKESAIYFAIDSMARAAALTANGKEIELNISSLPADASLSARALASFLSKNDINLSKINLSALDPAKAAAFKASLSNIAIEQDKIIANPHSKAEEVAAAQNLKNKINKLIQPTANLSKDAELATDNGAASSSPFAKLFTNPPKMLQLEDAPTVQR